MAAPDAPPTASAATTPTTNEKTPACGPPFMLRIQARVRPLRFAVGTIARLIPPDMIGASIARVSRPRSGN
jgi:hypothetical protein